MPPVLAPLQVQSATVQSCVKEAAVEVRNIGLDITADVLEHN